jgi:phosphoribosylformimino-5-aminoimidazole carboxamide ribotide isomerase
MWLHMRIVPVLDLMHGVVVRGIGGRRHEYRPIVSRLTASSAPLDVAGAFQEEFGFKSLYLADLDAIGGESPAWAVYEALRRLGLALWVDAGVRDAAMARQLADTGIDRVVIGLETVRGLHELAKACHELGDRLVFSLDLKSGQPLGAISSWGTNEASKIAAHAVEAGVRRLLVLDLSQVGSNTGTGTEDLCRALSCRHPGLDVAAGGGIRDLADLRRLEVRGVSTALVASALHDGTLRREHLAALRSPLDGC